MNTYHFKADVTVTTKRAYKTPELVVISFERGVLHLEHGGLDEQEEDARCSYAPSSVTRKASGPRHG